MTLGKDKITRPCLRIQRSSHHRLVLLICNEQFITGCGTVLRLNAEPG